MFQSFIIGYTVKNNPILLYKISGNAEKKIPLLFIGGVHGNESEGFLFLEKFTDEIIHNQIHIPEEIELYICPRLNIDGCSQLRRTNQNNVDLNRNLPTKDWTNDFYDPKYYPGSYPGSEPETKTTMIMLDLIKPKYIISFHSYEKPMINYNGDCLELAQEMSKLNHLEPKSDIGYPTPGSLGTYAGLERNYPTITMEILRGQDPESVWKQHFQAIIKAIEFSLS